MDFVRKDDLIAVMHAWVLAKDRPLGDLLAERGALRFEHQTLLDALVAAHLAQHDGDAQKSLAALSSLGPDRRDLEAVAESPAAYPVPAIAPPGNCKYPTAHVIPGSPRGATAILPRHRVRGRD